MMKSLVLGLLIIFSNYLSADTNTKFIKNTPLMTKEMVAQYPGVPVCSFARKDYDSPGFGITYRDGFYIKGQFGCVYYCGCNGKAFYVTHTYKDEYFDSEIWSKETGGPKRAKWFICPNSVKEDSWKPMYDEVGRSIGYNVDEDNSFFEPKNRKDIKELSVWQNLKCK